MTQTLLITQTLFEASAGRLSSTKKYLIRDSVGALALPTSEPILFNSGDTDAADFRIAFGAYAYESANYNNDHAFIASSETYNNP